ncbi:hypothetical protein MLD52_03735 [Puniceicoccaceae bacterium K14]|nr:hypothetical protein [Puniceicoccaceae bacterium K14]
MDLHSINDLVDALEEHGGEAVIKATRKKPISSFALRDLYKHYSDNKEFVLFLAQYPLIPSELAETISTELTDEDVEIAQALACNPRAPQQTLNRLGEHPSPAVRLILARNPNVTPKECQQLALDESTFVRATIAENPSLPSYLQFILAADTEPAVKTALAGRSNIDLDVAFHLSQDPSFLVKTAVLNNKEIEPEMFQMWADLDDETNQHLLIRRKEDHPKSVLQSVRYSTHPTARFAAMDLKPLNEAEMLWLAESDYSEDRIYLAKQPQIPAAIQRILAQDTSEKVRRHLADNDALEADIAERIAASHDVQACSALAKNSNTSHEVLSQLCLHPSPDVATLVAYRDDLQDSHWDLLVNNREDSTVAEHIAFQGIEYPHIQSTIAEYFATNDNPSLRAFAALALNQPPQVILTLSQDHCEKVREAAANNPNIPEQALRALIYDTNKEIAEVAEKALFNRKHPTTSSESDDTSDESSPRLTSSPSGSRRKILNKILTFFNE